METFGFYFIGGQGGKQYLAIGPEIDVQTEIMDLDVAAMPEGLDLASQAVDVNLGSQAVDIDMVMHETGIAFDPQEKKIDCD